MPEPLHPARFEPLADLLAAHACATPDKVAARDEDRALTYGELNRLVDRIAAGLQHDGVEPGGTVAICASSSVHYIATFLGVLRAGAAATPLAILATPDQLSAMIADSGASHLFTDAAGRAALGAALDQIFARRIDFDRLGWFAGWLPPAADLRPLSIDPHSTFNIIYSSGTTGQPKGIVHSHAMRAGLYGAAASIGFSADAITLVSTPLYSNTTLTAVLPTIAAGGTLVLMTKFDVAGFLQLAECHRATHAMLVPVQYRRLLDHPAFDKVDLSRLTNRYATSAPFPAELKAEVLRRWPGRLIEFYGLTEGGGSTMLLAHDHPDKLDTVGRAVPGHDIRAIDSEGKEVDVSSIGEIVGASGDAMSRYLNQPEKTEQSRWTSPDGRTYFRSGDLGTIDADGFVRIVGRAKDMIISGGFNIYPADLEQVLGLHPDIAEAAVIGVPSREWGETPAAFVVLRDGAATEPDDLRAWSNVRLGRTQRLADLVIVDALPRSAIGKVLKRELRARYAPS